MSQLEVLKKKKCELDEVKEALAISSDELHSAEKKLANLQGDFFKQFYNLKSINDAECDRLVLVGYEQKKQAFFEGEGIN